MTISKKICVIGDFSVGKTSLVRRFVHNSFSDQYLATLGVDISKRQETCQVGGKALTVDLVIWDVEGRPDDPALLKRYLIGAAGMLVVGDLSRDSTAPSIGDHLDIARTTLPGRPVAIALNKSDLVADQADERRRRIRQDLGAADTVPVMATSAKTGDAVASLFHELTTEIVRTGV